MPGLPHFVSKWLRYGVFLAALVGSISCGSREELSVDASFSLSREELVVSFNSNFQIVTYEVLGTNDDVILKSSIAHLRSGQIRIPPQVREVSKRIRFTSSDEQKSELDIPPIRSKVSIRSQFETADDSDGAMMVPAGSETSIAVDLGELGNNAALVRLKAAAPLAFKSSEGLVSSLDIPLHKGSQSVGGVLLITSVTTKSAIAAIQAGIHSEEGEAIAEVRRDVFIRPVQELRSAVRVTGTALPADSDDRTFGGRREGFVDLGTNSGGVGGESDSYPIAQQSVTLENNLSEPVSVLVTIQVQTESGDSAPAFDVPPYKPGPNVTSAARVPAEGRQTIQLPFYAQRSAALPGQYQRLVTVKLAGSNLILAEVRVPFEVGRSVNLALLTTGTLTVIALFIFGWLLMRRSRVLDRFTTRQIVLAGLFSAASVVIVNVPVYFLTSITVFLLGPMGFLIDGLLSEFVFFALITVLISIVPVQGICATVIGTRFLLGGVLLGMVTPVGILHAVTMGIALEAAVFISGAARSSAEALFVSGVRARLALLFALGNAFVSWVGFQLAIVLFRLHYADWYIFLSVLIGGFIYALLGGLAGRKIGKKLAEVVP